MAHIGSTRSECTSRGQDSAQPFWLVRTTKSLLSENGLRTNFNIPAIYELRILEDQQRPDDRPNGFSAFLKGN